MLKLKLQYFGHLRRTTGSLEKTLMLGKIEGGNDRGWDGWMASLTRWTWVWEDSGSWWWTGRPSVLRSIKSWTQLGNCTEGLFNYADKCPYSQRQGFSSGHVWIWELYYKENWAQNWCFWAVVLEKTLESPLDCKEIQPVHSKENQSWVFFGRTDAEAETSVLWPPHLKSWLIGKDPDDRKGWRREEKGVTEDEMVGWHHRLNGHESE